MSSLAYIDDTLDRAIQRDPQPTKSDRDKAARSAVKVVAGFHIKDEVAERAALDKLIAGRKALIERFVADRSAVRGKLADLGITPLAVVPTGAWNAICKQAGLFVLWTDAAGKVPIARDAMRGWGTEREFIYACKNNWVSILDRLFPNKTVTPNDRNPARATLVMPQPPADVAAVLLKAFNLSLKVAAVADAIAFKETPEQLYRAEVARQEQEARYREGLRNDPIVFHEHGTAAAIIAQFGDFPIEKQVVDAVAASDDLIPEKPSAVESIAYRGATQEYLDMLQRAQAAQRVSESDLWKVQQRIIDTERARLLNMPQTTGVTYINQRIEN